MAIERRRLRPVQQQKVGLRVELESFKLINEELGSLQERMETLAGSDGRFRSFPCVARWSP